MTAPQTFAVLRRISSGVKVLTSRASGPPVPAPRLRAEARRIEKGEVAAIALTPGGHGQRVLAVPTDTLVVRADLVDWIGRETLADVGGARRFADPYTAMLDVQWRLNLLGHAVVAEDGPPTRDGTPDTPAQEVARRQGLQTMLYTHLGEAWRGSFLATAQLLHVCGSLSRAGTDTTVLDLQRSPGGDDVGELAVPAGGLAGAYAVDLALDRLDEARGVRDYVQRTRRVPDRALGGLLADALPVLLDAGEDRELLDRLGVGAGLRDLLDEPIHVLLVAPPEGAPAQRADAIAAQLAGRVRLRRVDAGTDEMTEDGTVVPGGIPHHAGWADALVLEGVTLADAPGSAFTRTPLVVDLSTTDVVGWLMNAPRTDNRASALEDLCRRADRVLVADGAQRDVLLGALAGSGRVNDLVYDQDPSLETLVTVDVDGTAAARFCEWPCRAADVDPESAASAAMTVPRPNDMVLAVEYLKEGGIANVAQKAAGRIRRLATTKEGR